MPRTLSIPVFVLLLVALVIAGATALRAQSDARAALGGQVSSAQEGPMEGVIVSANRPGSPITVSVVSDARGRYAFPVSHLAPGRYRLAIRAAGYDLAAPSTVTVTRDGATANLRLVPAKDLSVTLSDAEWIASMPGTDAQKATLQDCNACHDLQRIVRSDFTADEWVPVLQRMMGLYVYNASPAVPQTRVVPRQIPPAYVRPMAEYLATINLSRVSRWTYPLKTLPRPKGEATRVIVTEYQLPRPTILTHDVVVDRQGYAWWTDFGGPFIGRLDPRTGETTEYPLPTIKANAAKGSNDLELDAQGNLWIGMLQQSAISRFNTRTKTFTTWPLTPPSVTSSIAMVTVPQSSDPTHIWTNDEGLQGMHRLDLATGTWENFGPLANAQGHKIGPYGIFADAQNNGYVLDYSLDGNFIGEIDAQTGKLTMYAVPTASARLRRGRLDGAGAFWVAEYGGNKIARFDLATKTYTEWTMPTPFTEPYDVVRDKNGQVWTGSMWTDHVVRLDPNTGHFVEYLLPRETNIRRVFIDNSTTPVTFWAGNNLHGSIVKLEPL